MKPEFYSRLIIGSVAAVVILLGVIACLGMLVTADSAVLTIISSLLGLITAIIATIVTWFITRHYALADTREHLADKIDTVAIQSHEKILNLSKQLFTIQRFIAESKQIAASERDGTSAACALAHRLDGVSHSLDQLRASNDTFCSDWIGVVSDEVREKMEAVQEAQRKVFDELRDLTGEVGQSTLQQISGDNTLFDTLKNLSDNAGRLPHAARPDIKVPAVTSHVTPDNENDEIQQAGMITLVVHRPVPIATGSGNLSPPMTCPPDVYAKLDYQKLPAGCPQVLVSAGSGTERAFNVHVKSKEYGRMLPVGKYEFRYTATASDDFDATEEESEVATSQKTGIDLTSDITTSEAVSTNEAS